MKTAQIIFNQELLKKNIDLLPTLVPMYLYSLKKRKAHIIIKKDISNSVCFFLLILLIVSESWKVKIIINVNIVQIIPVNCLVDINYLKAPKRIFLK